MATFHILFADNDSDFLDTRAEFLKKAGYNVLEARSLSEAEWLLKNANIHLAILDIRMENDDDDRDETGLALAVSEEFRHVPKIILTGHESADAVRIALKQSFGAPPPAIDFIYKAEGPDALIRAVNEALTNHVKINWDLAFEWKGNRSLSLVPLIEANLEEDRLIKRAEELEDLFRRTFYEKDHIRIDRLLWERNGRIALVVFTFKKGAKPESFVVICGQNIIVNEEVRCFEEFAPRIPGKIETILSIKAETTHFAANAYTLADNDLEKVQTLIECYRMSDEKIFRDSLNTLFKKTLQGWHQDKLMQKTVTLDTLYLQRLQLSDENFSHTDFDEYVKSIESQIKASGLRINHTNERITFDFNNQSLSYPNPRSVLSQLISQSNSLLVVNVPGLLNGENILTDAIGRVWLTDFADAGVAPTLWNFVEMEAIIRFDWIETNDLLRRQEMEDCLINTDFDKMDIRNLEPVIRKPVRAIQSIRKLASRTVGNNDTDYHLGIFFHAAYRIANFNYDHPPTTSEQARLEHVLLSMAMIAGKISEGKLNTPISMTNQTDELRISDEVARLVLVGNREIRLAPQPFALFQYLYLNANRVCTKDELIKTALKGEYEKDYLPTLIGRIRKAIEEDPEKPKYLVTEPSAGYRLIPKPKL